MVAWLTLTLKPSFLQGTGILVIEHHHREPDADKWGRRMRLSPIEHVPSLSLVGPSPAILGDKETTGECSKQGDKRQPVVVGVTVLPGYRVVIDLNGAPMEIGPRSRFPHGTIYGSRQGRLVHGELANISLGTIVIAPRHVPEPFSEIRVTTFLFCSGHFSLISIL